MVCRPYGPTSNAAENVYTIDFPCNSSTKIIKCAGEGKSRAAALKAVYIARGTRVYTCERARCQL